MIARDHRSGKGRPLIKGKDFIIRRAGSEDAGALARLAYMAGRGHVEISVYDLMVPGPPGPKAERLAVLERLATARAVSWFHYSHYTVAEVDGVVAASLGSFSKQEARNRDFEAALRETGWSTWDILTMGRNLRPFLKVNFRIPEGFLAIENVASFPAFRRRGLVNALLEAAVEKGREGGHRRMQISCFRGNTPAIKAYEKVGFTVKEERRDPSFEELFGCPGMCRLTLES